MDDFKGAEETQKLPVQEAGPKISQAETHAEAGEGGIRMPVRRPGPWKNENL